ncbi:MAG: amino acid transporter [Pseudolabrys sp.]
MSLVDNERTKLTASFFNALGAAVLAAGGFAPLAALAYGISDRHVAGTYLILLFSLCILVGAFLHLFGRWMLRSLEQ